MNFRIIEKILEKYFNGETSLQEEEQLRAFFGKEDIPPHLISLKNMFVFFDKEVGEEIPDDTFEKKIMDQIEEEKIISIKRKRRSIIYLVSGIAASILIIVTLFIHFNTFTRKINDTFNDPQMAYNEAKRIMMFVSEKLNKGTQPLEQMSKIDEGISNLKEISKFNTGIEEASKIEKYNKIHELITNPVIP